MKVLLSKEEVDLLNYKECQAAMRALAKAHDLEKPISKMTRAEFDLVDEIGNTILYLEDRMARFEDPRIPSMDPGQPVVKIKVEKTKGKTGPRRRRFRIGDVIYEDIYEAVKKTGVKVNTLRTYVGRKPDVYQYVD